jgi:SAM-dependent methyltransferase
MTNSPELPPATDSELQRWLDQWDLIQERYVVSRPERMGIMVALIRDTQSATATVLDLGCGTGTLLAGVLEALPEVKVIGIDFEPAVLRLAQARLRRYGSRWRTVLADLLDATWTGVVESPADAVVSSMTFHCFSPERLSLLYGRIPQVLRPGGIFLNADHVGSDSPTIQQAWRSQREKMLAGQSHADSEDWEGFWQKYSAAMGLNLEEIERREAEARRGHVEGGLPLVWHLDQLRQAGFVSVDCFWRSHTDAVYGGVRGAGHAEHSAPPGGDSAALHPRR